MFSPAREKIGSPVSDACWTINNMDLVYNSRRTLKAFGLALLVVFALVSEICAEHGEGSDDVGWSDAITGPETLVSWNRRSGASLRLERAPDRVLVRLSTALAPSTSPAGVRLEALVGEDEDALWLAEHCRSLLMSIVDLPELGAPSDLTVERVSSVYCDARGSEYRFHGDELTVRFEQTYALEERRMLVQSLSARVVYQTRVAELQVLRLEGAVSLSAALDLLRDEPGVRLAEPHYLVRPDFTAALPKDPLAGEQWNLLNSEQQSCYRASADIGVLDAWDVTRGDPNVVVAVLDSGMDLDHPDLEAQLYPRGDADWNFTLDRSLIPADGVGHGTNVAGIVAAIADNALGVSGVAPGCRLMPLKIDGLEFVLNMVEAMEYISAFQIAHPELRLVANGSVRTGPFSMAVQDAAATAVAAGVPLFFATGNANQGTVDFPASLTETIAVGASAPDDSRKSPLGCGGGLWGSNHGSALDIVAPGVNLPSTDIAGPPGEANGDFNPAFGGTSAASPVAAAVAALMLSVNPDLTPAELRALLLETADDQVGDVDEDTQGWDRFMGWGRVNAARAVRAATEARRFVRGDANLDGVTNVSDVVPILEYVFLAGELTCRDAADANDDGRLNLSDAIELVIFLFRGGKVPEAPYPDAGLDLTPDALRVCF
jgi:subtilisin family serine protease